MKRLYVIIALLLLFTPVLAEDLNDMTDRIIEQRQAQDAQKEYQDNIINGIRDSERGINVR